MGGEHNSGPAEAVKGTVEGVKGKAKEVLGAVDGQTSTARGKRNRTRLIRSARPRRLT